MSLLITGGAGFVLSHLALRWLQRNPEEKAILFDAAPLDSVAERFFSSVRTRLEVVQGDVCQTGDLLRRLDSFETRHVVHGATVTSINRLTTEGRGLSGAVPALETNIMGTLNLLAWAQQQPNLERFIYVSSGSVYGSHGPEQTGTSLPEEGYVAPEDYYAISKYTSELLTGCTAKQFDFPAVSVRFSGVYGPMDRETAARNVVCVPRRMAEAALAGRILKINDPSAVGDFIHAGDIADALCLLLHAGKPRHDVYNLAYGATVSLADLVEMTQAAVPGARCEVLAEAEAEISLDPRLRGGRWGAYDISRMTDEFGWRPTPIRDAYHSYIDWLRSEQEANSL